MRRALPALLLLIALPLSPGCFYKVGSGLMAGVLDEAGGKGKSEGVDPVLEGIVEKALLAELGHQLGQGLQSGVTEITPEQQAGLESTVDGLITVATMRAGKGLRQDVSPELRAMIQRDIVEAFAEGIRGELGSSLEETVDRLVTRAVLSLRQNLEQDELKWATADLLRDSIYLAMREGSATPAVGETLETTLRDNVLDPFSTNVEGLADVIAGKVDEQARRTEQVLSGIISALVVVLGVFVLMYLVRGRQLQREQANRSQKEVDLRSLNAALAQLDEHTRAEVEHKLNEVRGLVSGNAAPDDTDRSEDYLR
ncbi:MAG: hypothetical protein H6737_29230 [Alphaproteobacteria bacterium]|nr:hypothetical protein [Alphaproteobacteria bacterium]